MSDHRSEVALVTGASSGIGAATSRRLARAGFSVVLVARRGDLLNDLAAEIREAGGRAQAVVADISRRHEASIAVQQAVAEFGRLDALVNNAGSMMVGPFATAPEGEWERMVAVNVMGMLYVTQAALPHLKVAADEGPRAVADIVNIGSLAGRTGWPGFAVYSMTKSGIVGFSDALRQELQPDRIRVTLINPGTVTTDIATHSRSGPRERLEEAGASVEALDPDDVANLVAHAIDLREQATVGEAVVRAADQTW